MQLVALYSNIQGVASWIVDGLQYAAVLSGQYVTSGEGQPTVCAS